MSHLVDNEANIKRDCKFSLKSSKGWQYGQEFPDPGDFGTPEEDREFLVEPFECMDRAIRNNASRLTPEEFSKSDDVKIKTNRTHVFTKSIKQQVVKDVHGNLRLTNDRINKWESARNWGEMVASGRHNMEILNPSDPLAGVIMAGARNAGFKYRVRRVLRVDNGHPRHQWSCTCVHFARNLGLCCKHINACIDSVLWEQNQNQRVAERGLGWNPYKTHFDFGVDGGNDEDGNKVWRTTRHTYLGTLDIIQEINITEGGSGGSCGCTSGSSSSSSKGGSDGKCGSGSNKMYRPLFKQWST